MPLSARRRGGVRVVTAGFVLVGGSGFALLAAGPRLLGAASYSGLALVWTVSNLFGIGLAAPTEQVVTRGLNANLSDVVRKPMLRLAGVATIMVTLLLGFALSRMNRGDSSGPMLGMALAVAAWVPATWVRGRLAGAGDLVGYGWVLGVESVVRLSMIAGAIAVRGWAPGLLDLAVGLPVLVAASVGLLFRHAPRNAASEERAASVEQLSFVLYAVGFQVCLNGAPLLLQWRIGASQPALVGAFVSASTYFRMPTLLTGGILTKSLIDLSHAWGRSNAADFALFARRGMLQTTALVAGAIALLGIAAPFALPLYYGRPLRLPVSVIVGLAISTIAAMVAAAAVQPLLAAGRGNTVAAVWLAGAALTSGVLVAAGDVGTWTAVGLAAGPVFVAGAALVARSKLLELKGVVG